MTQPQIRLYRAEWSKCRKALRHYGRTPAQADAERMAIHERVCGSAKSSLALNNKEFSRVLAVFWSWSNAADLGLQMRQEHQPAMLGRHVTRDIFGKMAEIDPSAKIGPQGMDAYINGMYQRLNKTSDEPLWGNEAQWERVILAACYRYDQIARKFAGIEGRGTQRFWPYRHEETLAELGINLLPEHIPVPEPETADSPF